MLQYVLALWDRLTQAGELAQENLRDAQRTQAYTYNWGTRTRTFQPRDRVLVLLPTEESKLLARWQSLYEVTRQVGPINYEIHQPHRRKPRQVYHVSLLKPWREQEALMVTPYPPEPELGS